MLLNNPHAKIICSISTSPELLSTLLNMVPTGQRIELRKRIAESIHHTGPGELHKLTEHIIEWWALSNPENSDAILTKMAADVQW